MISSSLDKVIIVADNRKIGFNHNFLFADIENIDYLITDSEANALEVDKIRKKGWMSSVELIFSKLFLS